MRDREDLGRVAGLDAAAVEQAEVAAIGEPRGQRIADRGMDLGDLGAVGGAAGADRPDGFVGDDGVPGAGAVGDRARKLARDHIQRLAAVALRLGLAHADDGGQARLVRGLRLGGDGGVILGMVGAAFGMAHDHVFRARVGQLRGGEVAGMRAVRVGMAVLSADRHRLARDPRDHGVDQRRGRADQDLAVAILTQKRVEFGQRRQRSVHLPVAGGKLAHGPSLRFRCENGLGEDGGGDQAGKPRVSGDRIAVGRL